jgi:hypothetical protein
VSARRAITAILLSAAIAAPVLPAIALAQDSADALIERGLALRARQRDADALLLFERAFAMQPTPRAQAQIALAQGALARWREADRNLRTALSANSDPWIAARRAILEDALATIDGNLGGVQVVGSAVGAGVQIAGEDAGTVPMSQPMFVEPGRVQVQIRRPGVPIEMVELEVAAGGRVEHRADAAPPVEPVDPVGEPPVPEPVDPPGDRDTGGSGTMRTLGYVSLGVAGAMLVTGVIAYALREGHAADFNDDPECGTDVAMPTAACLSYQQSFDRAGAISIVGFAAAGVFAAVGLVLILTGGDAAPQESAAIGCHPSASGLRCHF